MGLVKGFAVEPAGIFPGKDTVAKITPNGVIALIAQNGCSEQNAQGQGQIQQAHAAQRPHHKHQGVARQKRHHHHPCFDKNNQKQQGVDPGAIRLHKAFNVAVDVKHKINGEGE